MIFEGYLPAALPRSPILAIAPPRTSPLGDVTGKLTNPGIGTLDPDEPVLRFVDLSTTHISEAVKLATPGLGADDHPRSARRAAALRRVARRTARHRGPRVRATRSDLPLQVAFPILLANLTGELLGSSTAPTEAVEPGTPVELHIPAGAIGLTVTGPDGTATELVPSSTDVGAAAVTFAATGLPGVYTVTPKVDPNASPVPSAAGSPVGRARPRRAVGLARRRRPARPGPLRRRPVRRGRIDDRAGSRGAIEALGTAAGGRAWCGQPRPGHRRATTTRDELWVPIVLSILAFPVHRMGPVPPPRPHPDASGSTPWLPPVDVTPPGAVDADGFGVHARSRCCARPGPLTRPCGPVPERRRPRRGVGGGWRSSSDPVALRSCSRSCGFEMRTSRPAATVFVVNLSDSVKERGLRGRPRVLPRLLNESRPMR